VTRPRIDYANHIGGRLPRILYQQDQSLGSGELTFQFEPEAAATRRPASETNAFIMGLYGQRSVV
jgi:hypothetical protein